MKIISVLLSLFIYIIPSQLLAESAGKIEAMQMPAWVKHNDGQREPLKPGMMVQSGDQLITGQSSRLLIRLSEGSHLKLGESAQLNFDKLQSSEEKQGYFEALIKVAKGAFRFTTTAFGQNKKRNIKVKVGVITAGVRGTDIWGKSDNEKDLLALLEGSISVQRDGEPEFSMADPLSYYLTPKDKPAEPIQTVPQNQLAQWAAETELLNGVGVLTIDGQWNVNLMSLTSLEDTAPIRKRFADSGYATEVQKFVSLGRNWYRIKIKGFQTREDAKVFASTVDGLHGTRKPWVGKS
jgi:hypothetical protein